MGIISLRKVNRMDALLLILIPLLIEIESGGDNNAIGDGGKAVGCLQIHKIMVDDVQRIRKSTFPNCGWYYSYEDRLNIVRSKMMAEDFFRHYGPKRISKDNTELENLRILGRMWNGGPEGYKKKSTIPYSNKISRLMYEKGLK